jgi:hypothetical protein
VNDNYTDDLLCRKFVKGLEGDAIGESEDPHLINFQQFLASSQIPSELPFLSENAGHTSHGHLMAGIRKKSVRS